MITSVKMITLTCFERVPKCGRTENADVVLASSIEYAVGSGGLTALGHYWDLDERIGGCGMHHAGGFGISCGRADRCWLLGDFLVNIMEV